MSGTGSRAPFEAFFLKSGRAERFCVFYAPRATPVGSVLYVHPFAEEMNRSRRMAALQARAFAARGYAVLQIDLLGCGESSGSFADARWLRWKDDVRAAQHWLRHHAEGAMHLWGLRLGALLAADCAREEDSSFASLLMWQPLTNGAQFMTQFLRLRLGSEMLAGAAARTGTDQLRAQLAAGRALEIAGYELTPGLASEIDRLDLAALAPKNIPAHWFEVSAETTSSPALQRAARAWQAAGAEVDLHLVRGEPFWNSVEISECPHLIAATSNVVSLTPA